MNGSAAWMRGIRLRTKFLLSLLILLVAFLAATLLIVRGTVELQTRKAILADLRNSVSTFQNFQRQGESTLTHSAELLANLPNLKALMTTQDAATIQDSSADLWRLAGSDLFVLADRTDRIVAYQVSKEGLTRAETQELLARSTKRGDAPYWWFGGGHLYEVFLQPVFFGSAEQNSPLGVVALGHEIDDSAAKEVSRIAASEVAFCYGQALVVSTLTPAQENAFTQFLRNQQDEPSSDPEEIQVGGERYLTTSIELDPGSSPVVSLRVLKSFDQATMFLDRLNRRLLVVGLIALLAGAISVFLISDTFTRPLADLVGGVRALEQGDFQYLLEPRGGDEVAEVTNAFDKMRATIQRAQQQLVDSERLATIGRMASSISHDLRHPMTAIMANAEFLSADSLDHRQREDLYKEIRLAIEQMTDLVESLLEFSRARSQMRLVYGSLRKTIERAIQVVRTRSEFGRVQIALSCEGSGEGWFDAKKIERVFYNLVLNACEAILPAAGKVEISVRETRDHFQIRVADSGPGIPGQIRDKLFQPFISFGKENGTGLGLTVVQKILQDHGGEIVVERTSAESTVFRIILPIQRSPDSAPENAPARAAQDG